MDVNKCPSVIERGLFGFIIRETIEETDPHQITSGSHTCEPNPVPSYSTSNPSNPRPMLAAGGISIGFDEILVAVTEGVPR